MSIDDLFKMQDQVRDFENVLGDKLSQEDVRTFLSDEYKPHEVHCYMVTFYGGETV